jgi:hypothetical protein
MKNISGQYQDLLEGKMTQAQFLRNARMMFPSFVTQHNSFADSVIILKQKGMLNEGDAVKGTPDKEPTYESPTPDVKTKYKKVEQSPEVDEQNGIYPATTLTDIPKVKANKKVKNESDGLEPIKDNDTKNEMNKIGKGKSKTIREGVESGLKQMGYSDSDIEDFMDEYKQGGSKLPKKVRDYLDGKKELKKEGIHDKDITSAPHTNVKGEMGDYDPKARAASLARLKNMGPKKDVKENQRSFDDIFADFIETDDSTEIRSYIKSKGKEAISKIKAEIPKTPDRIRKALVKLLKIELDEVRTNKTSFDYKSTFEDLVIKTNTAGKSDFNSLKQNWIERVENSKINPDTKKQMLNSINAINSLLDLQKFASYGLLKYEKMAVKESVLEQLVTKIMNETLAKKSAR